MAFQLLFIFAATTLLIIIPIIIMRHQRVSQALHAEQKSNELDFTSSSPKLTMLSKSLALALPNSVILPHNAAAFMRSTNVYWARQECEVTPACVVQPRNVHELSTAINVLKHEYNEQQADKKNVKGLFAIRSGGHSPISGAASIAGGVVIDLGFLCEVIPSEDGSTVVIGAGAKWMDVSKVLDERGLAVIGGRNSAVGVGGLTLGGKLLLVTSAFGPLACTGSVSKSYGSRQQLLHISTSILTPRFQ